MQHLSGTCFSASYFISERDFWSHTLTFGLMLRRQLLQWGWAGPFKLSTVELLVWEGLLFHLALLLCARQVVKRREEERERVAEQERGWRERRLQKKRDDKRERKGKKGHRRCLAGLQLSVKMAHRILEKEPWVCPFRCHTAWTTATLPQLVSDCQRKYTRTPNKLVSFLWCSFHRISHRFYAPQTWAWLRFGDICLKVSSTPLSLWDPSICYNWSKKIKNSTMSNPI